MLHHDYVDELLEFFASDDGGGVRLCHDWVGRILKESHHSVNDAAAIIFEHIDNGTHQLATVNEVIDVDDNNNGGVPPDDVAIANADDDDAAVNEADVGAAAVNQADVDVLLAMFAGGGGVPLCRDWVGRILQKSRHDINDAAAIIFDHVTKRTHQLATVNEVIDVDANNRDDVPDDVAAANANDDDATEEEDLQGRAKKSRTGGTPKKPSPPESERASFSTPTKGKGDNRTHVVGGGRGDIVDLVNSMGSAHLNDDTATGNDVHSEGVTLRRRDGEEEDSKMPPGADGDLKMPAEKAEVILRRDDEKEDSKMPPVEDGDLKMPAEKAEVIHEEVEGRLLFSIFLLRCLLIHSQPSCIL